ncbi:uncharacterized protein METZ01_LOCUS201318 [marine metagenome]|uniref:JmjC domain-containing protein n=1 Tax=marine metagenome TaxID=408172 RepID=A0A382EEH7_9ZZZZ
MECLNPFPIVFKDTYDFDFVNKHKEKFDMIFTEIEPENNTQLEKGGGTSSVSRTYTDPPHEWSEFAHFNAWIMDRANMIADVWNFDARCGLAFTESWCNVHPQHAWTSAHHHQGIAIATASYLWVPPDSGRFLLQNPYEHFKRSEPVREEYHMAAYDWIPVDVKTNDVLFFPGWLSHKTEKNINDEERYVMSCNISAMEPMRRASPKEPREVLAKRFSNKI